MWRNCNPVAVGRSIKQYSYCGKLWKFVFKSLTIELPYNTAILFGGDESRVSKGSLYAHVHIGTTQNK
jgi:hypothetical protein